MKRRSYSPGISLVQEHLSANAIGVVARHGYDSQGNRTGETNAFGVSEQTFATSQYDSFGYLTNIIDLFGSTTSYTYDTNGNRLTERRQRTLASGSAQTLWTTNVYDAANRIIAVIEPDGFTNRTVYNGIGKVAYTTNKVGVVTRFDYDARGLLTNTVFALGAAQQASEPIAGIVFRQRQLHVLGLSPAGSAVER